MNFGDKLSQLRKKNGLSQEELGEKLNVTRQTISKWELGQTKPDADKLLEICRVLDADFNQLVDDKRVFENNKVNTNINSDDVRPRKWLLILLIIVAITIVIILANKYVIDKKAKDEKSSNIFDVFGNLLDTEDFETSSFNNTYEMKRGTNMGTFVSSLIDDIITNNKTNNKHIITVVFGDLNSNNPNELKEAKKNIETFSQYEVSLDYDKDGYVNMVTIEKLEEEENIGQFDIKNFNNKYELFYAGTTNGFLVNNMLDDIITNNKTNQNHTIRVLYDNFNTTDETEIRNLKKILGDVMTNYEVIFDYDDIGFINQVTIQK